jgi:dipeptidyl aminopeptidase/acylaminoacyl peptidase
MFIERPDVPRTMYHASGHYRGDWDSILREHSPLHQIEHMPNVPYVFTHGDADRSVNKVRHSDEMVKALRQRGFDVIYHELPGMDHGQIPDPVTQEIREFIWSLAR